MRKGVPFDLIDFLPYLLNLAAEQTSSEFQKKYKRRYGMLRTEWRLLFHLGRYGEMTAKEFCERAGIHKTKVSRAVSALEDKRFLGRVECADDRRREILSLTKTGRATYKDLCKVARRYDAQLSAQFTKDENEILHRCLQTLAHLPAAE